MIRGEKVLLAFLDSLNYHYITESDNDLLTEEQVKALVGRKADFIAGKTTSRPWDEIKKPYEGF